MTPPDPRFSHERMAFRDTRRTDPSLWSATSEKGMVATAHYLATAAGAEMLAAGGNAVDAAVAASLALGVCEPAGSGLGGMTVALVHQAQTRKTVVLSGPCRAPRRATPDGLRGRSRYRGHHAVAVPTNAAVLHRALSYYGTLGREQVLEPAIRIAEQGFPITSMQEKVTAVYRRPLRNWGGGRLFLDASHRPLPAGSWMRQEALAATLRRLATAGFEDFYHGEIAKRISGDMESHNGFLRLDDLRDYGEVTEGPPLEGRFGELRAASFGPPGGGEALMHMFEELGRVSDGRFDPGTPEGIVLLAEIIRRARLNRRFVAPDGAAGKGSKDESAPGDRGTLPAGLSGNPEGRQAVLEDDGETSHVTVADKQGNWVSMTQSLERSFGSAAFDPELGFLYNGYMRTFKLRTPGHPHFLRPGAAARSNAAPTLLFEDGKPWAAIGNTGSERLASGILQVLVRLQRQTPFESVLAPRLHCSPEGVVLLESERFRPESIAALLAKGYELQHLDAFSFKVGGLQLIVKQGDSLCGVAEPRRDGAAAGPQ